MIRMLRATFAIFLLLLAACSHVSAKVPEKFYGNWVVTLDSSGGFPWWQQIKYPVSLSITEKSLRFTDQSGHECEPEIYFYDDDLQSLIFKHCLPNKSSMAFSPFYRLRYEGDALRGETWTYKLLFQWRGSIK